MTLLSRISAMDDEISRMRASDMSGAIALTDRITEWRAGFFGTGGEGKTAVR